MITAFLEQFAAGRRFAGDCRPADTTATSSTSSSSPASTWLTFSIASTYYDPDTASLKDHRCNPPSYNRLNKKPLSALQEVNVEIPSQGGKPISQPLPPSLSEWKQRSRYI
jgi:hypothetical protein